MRSKAKIGYFLTGFALLMWISVIIEADRYEVKTVAASIYEFRDVTGNWPVSIEDLRNHTSLRMRLLPKQSWEQFIGDVVIVWPNNLSRTPDQSRNVILVYQQTGKRLWPFRWVCWGDLRTEYISTSRLNAALASDR